MRSLKDNQALTPIQVNSQFPNGAIIDETSTQPGTAVVREIYNDLLVNVYKILNTVGMATNGVEDSEGTSYQLLAALQKFTNVQNDIENTLSLASTTWNLNLNIDLLPDKYFMFARAAGAYVSTATYNFKGASALSYPFTSPTGFNSGDELLLIIDHSGVRAYSFGGGAAPAPGGSASFNASAILGSDPFFYLPLSGTAVPQYPKYLTMYIKNGDGDNQNKMVFPAYIADTRIIQGMPNPADWPGVVIKLYWL